MIKSNITYLIGAALGNGMYFVITPIVLYYLTKDEFADTELFYTYSLVGLYLLGFNVHVSITRFKFENDFDLERKRSYERNIFLLIFFSFLLQLVIVALFGNGLSQLLEIPKTMVRALPFGITAMFLYNAVQTILVSDKKAKNYSFFQGLVGLSKLAVIVIFFMFLDKASATVKVLAESTVVVTIGVLFFLRFYAHKSSIASFGKDLKYAVAFSLPLIFYVLGNVVLNFSDQWLIKYYMDKESLAIYSLAYRYAFISMIFSIAISNYFAIDYYDNFEGNAGRLKSSLKQNQLMLFAFCSFLIVLKHFFLQIITDWDSEVLSQAASIIEIIVVSYFVLQFYLIWIRLLFHLKMTLLISLILGAGVLVNVVLNVMLIPNEGLIGAAYATLVSATLVFVLSIIYHKLNTNLNGYYQLHFARHLLLTTVLALVCYLF